MIVTAATYRTAAERLFVLSLRPDEHRIRIGPHNQLIWVDRQAADWARQLRGAAEAFDHLDRRLQTQIDRLKAERDDALDRATNYEDLAGRVYEYFVLEDSPSPTWREKGAEALRDCARRLGLV